MTELQTYRFAAQGETVTLRCCGAPQQVVYLHEGHDDGAAVWRQCLELGCHDFALASIRIPASLWNDVLTPWECPGLFADDAPFAGHAEKQLELLLQEIAPEAERLLALADGKETGPSVAVENHDAGNATPSRILAGYSLAGLFAVWVAFQTDAFSRIVSASGSLWYPKFDDFAKTHPFPKLPECAYFSLGSKEARTPSRLLRRVAEETAAVVSAFQEKGVEAVFEKNPGNHFKEPDVRMAKGIAWALRR